MSSTTSRITKWRGWVIPEVDRGCKRSLALHRVQRGFTLVELLAVMAIIGILAGVVAGSVSGLSSTGVAAQIKSDTKVLETSADRFFNDSFPQAYPVLELPSGQTDLGVRALNFDARLPQDPTKIFSPDFVKDIPDSAALVSYRIETAIGNVFPASDGADFAPPSEGRFNVSPANKEVSGGLPSQATETSDVTFEYTMRKNRAAVEVLKLQIPAGYTIGGQSLADGDDVGKLTIKFSTDNPWKSGQVVQLVDIPVEATGESHEWDIVVNYATFLTSAGGAGGDKVLLDPTNTTETSPTLTHTISITEGSDETPGDLTLTIARPADDEVAHNRATETWTLTLFAKDPSGGDLVINPSVEAVYRWLAEEQSTIQLEGVFDRVAGKQAVIIKDFVTE